MLHLTGVLFSFNNKPLNTNPDVIYKLQYTNCTQKVSHLNELLLIEVSHRRRCFTQASINMFYYFLENKNIDMLLSRIVIKENYL